MIAHAVNPILNVTDFQKSVEWFEKLGWEKLWDWGDPPTFGAVGSGNVEIFLCHQCQGGRGSDGVWMSLWVADVDAVHEKCVELGYDIQRPPADMEWNVREMHLRHPDGHTFRIGTGIPED